MTNGSTLKSWFARHSVVPVDKERGQPPKAVAAKPRVRDTILQSHAKASGSFQSSSNFTGKSQSLRSNQLHPQPFGMRNGDKERNDNIVGGIRTMHSHDLHVAVKPPVSVHCEVEYDPPMSQLSFAEDWSGVASYASHSGKSLPHHLPRGQYSQSDSSKLSASRGIHPFNMNRSATISSSTASLPPPMNSNQTTASMSGSAFHFEAIPSAQRHLVAPKSFSLAQTSVSRLPMKHHTDMTTGSFPKNIHQGDFSHDFSQSSGSKSGSLYPGTTVPDGMTRELLDHRIKAILKENFESEMKEFDDRQHFLYRRISEAEDSQADYIREVELKHKECMNQLEKLGKNAANFDRQVTNASIVHTKRCNELDKQVKSLESSAGRIENVHQEAVRMLKSVELSTAALKKLVETSMSAVCQAKETVIQSTLPFLKQKVVEMATVAFKDLGIIFQAANANSPIGAIASTSGTVDQVKGPHKRRPLMENNSQDSSSVASKNKVGHVAKDARKECSAAPNFIQPSQTLSPAVEIKSRFPARRVSTLSTSPTFSTRSCVTPCPKEKGKSMGHLIVDTCTPKKKRPMPSKNVRAKRQRSRFGHIRSLHIDNEEEYAFLAH